MYGSDCYETIEMPFILSIVGGHISKTAEYIIKEHHDEVEAVYEIIKFVLGKVEKEGLLGLEECLEDIKGSRAPLTDFLEDYILLIVDGVDTSLVLEMIGNEFIIREPGEFGKLVLFLYTITLMTAPEKSGYSMAIYREKAWKNLVRIKNEYMVFLPKECRQAFEF